MRAEALEPYERALSAGGPVWLWPDGSRAFALDVDRWRSEADDTDLDVVRCSRPPVLDVGCGPGRMVAALTDHGRLALGIDVSPRAVSMTRARGLNVLRRDVFDPLPGERRWRTIVVLDGSIGIGGDLPALLLRLRHLLAADGQLLVETHPDAARRDSRSVRLGTRLRPVGPAFAWASVGASALGDIAYDAGLAVVDTWTRNGRTFVALEGIPGAAEAAGPS